MATRGPADHHVLGESTGTFTHIALASLVFILATPTFNPILVTCELLDIPPLAVSTAAVLFFTHAALADVENIFFYSMRVFLHSILSIFFRSIEVVGAENIPPKGPVIFTGNHSNQFVDGLQVLCHARHRVGFLIAEKSYNTPLLGHCAALIGCMPVKRPQDAAKKCTGKLLAFDEAKAQLGGVVRGEGTRFTAEVAPGDKVRRRGCDAAFRVKAVASDNELVLSPVPAAAAGGEAEVEAKLEAAASAAAVGDVAFDVLGRVDQGAVFSRVLESLVAGRCLGIFPEGGSSDRSWFTPGELLGLKPGVAIIAMEANRQHKLAVPIVPVGMQYFEGDRFRGRCVIEFGTPIVPSNDLFARYAAEKARGESGAACTTELLETIEDGMKGCLVKAPSYEELEMVYMVRRLFSRDSRLRAEQKQDLNRRFAYWYSTVYLAAKASGKAIPADLEVVNVKIRAYRDSIQLLGLKDYQVRHLQGAPLGQILATIAHLVVVLALGSVPMLLLNLPVGLFARATADAHMAIALAGSNVKVEARDVRLSKMILTCMWGIPALWAAYAVLMLLWGVPLKAVGLYLFWCPFFSAMAVFATEAGMADLKNLKPLLLRLMVNKSEMVRLIDERKALQADVRRLVKQYGPEMGEVYFQKTVSWNNLQKAAQGGSHLTPPPPTSRKALPPHAAGDAAGDAGK